jgi:integrase
MISRIRVHVIHYKECKNLILRYQDPTTGKYHRKSAGTASRKDARKEAGKWEDELNSGKAPGLFVETWEAFRLRYELEVLTALARRTADKVDGIFNVLERTLPAVAKGLLRDLTAERISRLQSELRKAGRAEATIQGHLAHLRAALAWAVDQGLIPEVPRIRKPKRAKRSGKADPMKGRPITLEEFERMLAAVPKALTVKQRNPKTQKVTAIVPSADVVESWRHLLKGLWWSGLRLGEALNLYWDRPDRLCVDLSGKRPMLRITAECEKGNRDRLLPVVPEFAEFLLATPAAERHGRVFKPLYRGGEVVTSAGYVCRAIGCCGRLAGVKVRTETKPDPKTGEPREVVKFASAHDCRRSFGERWSSRVMPQILMALMRHESIDTSLRYYIGRNAQVTADAAWAAYSKVQEGTVSGTIGESGQSATQETETQPLLNNGVAEVAAVGVEPTTRGL